MSASVVLAAGLRLYRLSLQSLWFDEWIIYFGLSSSSLITYLRNLFVYLGEMAVTPIYLSLAYIVSVIFGEDIVALRTLSIVPGIFSVILLYLLSRRLGGRRAGLVAALCLALSPQHIWHNQEIRPYSLLFMACLLALLGLVYWRDQGRRRWLLLNFLANGLLIFTHLFGVLFLLPQGLYLLGRKEYKVFMRWSGAHLFFVALLLLAILVKPHLSEGYHGETGLSLTAMIFRAFPSLLLRSFCADVLRWHTGIWPWFESGAAVTPGPWLQILLWIRPVLDWALTVLLLGSISAFWFIGGRCKAPEKVAAPRADRLLLLSIIFVPSVILATLTLATASNFSDYGHDIYATIGIYVAIGMVFSRFSRRVFIMAVVLLIALYGYQCLLFLPGATRSDWRSGAAYIREHAAPEDLVLDLWWNGPISRREPYFSDAPQTFQRVNTLLAVAEKAEDFFDAHVKLEEEENASPSVWLLTETRFWREWFPDHDFMPLLTEALQTKGLSFSVREFPGGFNLTVVKIYPSPDSVPNPQKDGTSRFWTCDYEQVLYAIGIPQTDSQRKQELLHTLERTIGVWPGVSAMGRVTYPLDLLMTGDLELAEAMAKHIILENPSFGLGYLALAFVRAAQGEPAHAAAAYQSARAHHLGLGYFFDAYFDALCVQKDLETARAALEQVQRLKIPLFHETEKQVLVITSSTHQRPETRPDETQAPSGFTPPAPSSQRPCVLSEHPATLAGVWEEDSSRDVPAVWVEQLFDKQEHAAQLAQWLPFHKQVRGIAAKFLFKISSDVESGIQRYAQLVRQFPFEKRFYEEYDRLLKIPGTSSRYIQAWTDCVNYNPEITPYGASKLARAGTAWYLEGNADAAIHAYTAACDLEKENIRYRLRLAQLYEFCGATPEALYWYGRALEADPNTPAILDRAVSLLEGLSPQEAVLFWKALFRAQPAHWRIGTLYGAAVENAEEYEAAAEVYREMGEHHPGQADTQLARSRCLRLSGHLSEARGVLSDTLAASPDAKALATYELIELGRAFAGKSEFGPAEECHTGALATGEHQALANFSLGELWLERGDTGQAISFLRQAADLDPENPWRLFVLAQAEETHGDTASALSHYERALRLAPDDAAMAEHLDALLAKENAVEERVRIWRQLAEDHPGNKLMTHHYNEGLKAVSEGLEP